MPLRITITGGAGYIGSILTPALLAAGHKVRVLDAFRFHQNSLMECCADPNFEVIRGDCRDERTLAEAIRDADFILPLAGMVGAPQCAEDRVGAQSVNAGAIHTLIQLRVASQRIVFPCTDSGYGVGEKDRFCDEDSPLRPISLYGTSKVEAEAAVLGAGNGISLRLATVFGVSPRMRVDLLVNDFVLRAVHDRAVVVFEGHFKRNYIHVRDVARAFLHAIDNFASMRDRPYNVGLSDANLSKLELCARIKEHILGFAYFEAPIGEDPDKRDYIVSNARIAATGFAPSHSLDMGIEELRKAYTILRPRNHANA
jgi:nucleoside-diphosphate-sugar epimerase